jgi:type IV pilus assembly protein PilN
MSTPQGLSQGSLVLDLLRERRRELGHEPLSATLAQRGSLLRKGALVGGILAGGTLALCGLLALQRALVEAELGQLKQFEEQAAALKSEKEIRQVRLNSITKINSDLADALTSGRTSSALLTALQLSTPVGVQLLAADSTGPSLVIKGRAFDPLALVRINALQLQLERSPLLEGKAVKLTKVERQPPTPAQAPSPAAPGSKVAPRPAPPAPPPPLAFEITGPFAELPPTRQLEVLRELGSEGMARRLQLLRAEGLLP